MSAPIPPPFLSQMQKGTLKETAEGIQVALHGKALPSVEVPAAPPAPPPAQAAIASQMQAENPPNISKFNTEEAMKRLSDCADKIMNPPQGKAQRALTSVSNFFRNTWEKMKANPIKTALVIFVLIPAIITLSVLTAGAGPIGALALGKALTVVSLMFISLCIAIGRTRIQKAEKTDYQKLQTNIPNLHQKITKADAKEINQIKGELHAQLEKEIDKLPNSKGKEISKLRNLQTDLNRVEALKGDDPITRNKQRETLTTVLDRLVDFYSEEAAISEKYKLSSDLQGLRSRSDVHETTAGIRRFFVPDGDFDGAIAEGEKIRQSGTGQLLKDCADCDKINNPNTLKDKLNGILSKLEEGANAGLGRFGGEEGQSELQELKEKLNTGKLDKMREVTGFLRTEADPDGKKQGAIDRAKILLECNKCDADQSDISTEAKSRENLSNILTALAQTKEPAIVQLKSRFEGTEMPRTVSFAEESAQLAKPQAAIEPEAQKARRNSLEKQREDLIKEMEDLS